MPRSAPESEKPSPSPVPEAPPVLPTLPMPPPPMPSPPSRPSTSRHRRSRSASFVGVITHPQYLGQHRQYPARPLSINLIQRPRTSPRRSATCRDSNSGPYTQQLHLLAHCPPLRRREPGECAADKRQQRDKRF